MAYLTIEYDENLEVLAVHMPDGAVVDRSMSVPFRDNPVGPGLVDMITVSEIIEWRDTKGVRMLCVHHRCRKYC
jgi:hypothetical protein